MTIDRKKLTKSADMEKLSTFRRQLLVHPRLTYLFVELTERCNLACLHCGSSCARTNGHVLEADLLIKALRDLAADEAPQGIMVCLTGGEPMLHSDFFRIVQEIVRLGFPWGMTTNGTLIDATAAIRLRELCLASLTVSLDGLEEQHDWLRNTKGSFQRTLHGIACLKEAGIPIQVTTVVHKKNFFQLEQLYRFLCELEIPFWRIINLEPIGRALEHPDLQLSYEEMLQLLDYIREKRYASSTPMEICYGCSHYLSFEYERELRDNYFLCGAGILVGSILANGDIASCLDIERRPELVQGNIQNDRFSDVWRNRFQVFRADRAEQSLICRDCPERSYCTGASMHPWDFEKREPAFCILNPRWSGANRNTL